jgi:hypothetical protein
VGELDAGHVVRDGPRLLRDRVDLIGGDEQDLGGGVDGRLARAEAAAL